MKKTDRISLGVSGAFIVIALLLILLSGCTYTGRTDPYISGPEWTGYTPAPASIERMCLVRA